MPIKEKKQFYDSLLWAVFCESKDTNIFPQLSIPKYTRYTWCKRKPPVFVSYESFDKTKIVAENEKLRTRFSICTATIPLLKNVLLILDFRLDKHRLPNGSDTSMLTSSIEKNIEVLLQRKHN